MRQLAVSNKVNIVRKIKQKSYDNTRFSSNFKRKRTEENMRLCLTIHRNLEDWLSQVSCIVEPIVLSRVTSPRRVSIKQTLEMVPDIVFVGFPTLELNLPGAFHPNSTCIESSSNMNSFLSHVKTSSGIAKAKLKRNRTFPGLDKYRRNRELSCLQSHGSRETAATYISSNS